MEENIFRDQYILPMISNGRTEEYFICPKCNSERKKKNRKTLSVGIKEDRVVYLCHHCGIKGMIPFKTKESMKIAKVTNEKDIIYNNELNNNQKAFLKDRMISCDSIPSNVVGGYKYFGEIKKHTDAIGFKYINPDGSIAIKWRSVECKVFMQEGGSIKSLWGIENFNSGDIIIVEGEMDQLSYAQIDINAYSVPNGAPQFASKFSGVKYDYLWEARDAIKTASRIIISTDGDEKGELLAEEISRRFGRHRCWNVKYPDGCKDANDVLIKHGSSALKKIIDNAVPWPINGLRSVKEYSNKVFQYHISGPRVGAKTGVKSIDKLYRMAPGAFTVVTGMPGSGKSTWLSWLMVTLAKRDNSKFAFWSREMPIDIMISQLCQLYKGKKFQNMTPDEVSSALDWVNEHFVIIDTDDGDIDSIIESASAAVLRNGINGLVIDPFNLISVNEVGDEATLSKIKYVLGKIKNFSTEYDLHSFLVAHPRKMQKEGGKFGVPVGYDISGSADFYNMCDVGLSLSRGEFGESIFTTWKIRFEHFGTLGNESLSFNKDTGDFSDIAQSSFKSFPSSGSGSRSIDSWISK